MLCICMLCMFLENFRKGWHCFWGSTKQFHSKLNDDVEVNGWMANVVPNEMWDLYRSKDPTEYFGYGIGPSQINNEFNCREILTAFQELYICTYYVYIYI